MIPATRLDHVEMGEHVANRARGDILTATDSVVQLNPQVET